MRDQLLRRLYSAWRGRSLWHSLVRDHDLDDGAYVLLMIEDDDELNRLALRHIEDLVADRGARGVVILTDRPDVAAAADAVRACSPILAVARISSKQVDALLALSELYRFTHRLLVVSWTRPFGSDLRAALGVHGVTAEDVLCLSMLLLRTWPVERSARA